ncbi:MAG: cysteine hydrolase [Terracidiphilus sp.]
METNDTLNSSRRRFLTTASASAAAALFVSNIAAEASGGEQSGSASTQPTRSLKLDKADTAVVIIDPQNDVLSEKGLAWPLLHESLKEINTVENIERIFKAAKTFEFEVFISPHYFFPEDKGWKFNGPLETDEADSGLFGRKGKLTLDGFKGSGADWLERYKPYIEDGKTVVVSPHRVWGPETNDLVLQLRKRRISKIILGGMLANMCVESHLRELLEQGFEVAVVKDATAAPKHPEWGYGYAAALINYAFLAHAVLTTDEAVKAMERGSR